MKRTLFTIMLFGASIISMSFANNVVKGIPSGQVTIVSPSEYLQANMRYARNTSALGIRPHLFTNVITKENVVEECLKYLSSVKHLTGIDVNNLALYNVVESKNTYTAIFNQVYDGYEVKKSFVRMYVNKNGVIQTFASQYFDDIKIDTSDFVSPVVEANSILRVLDDLNSTQYSVNFASMIVYPCNIDGEWQYRLANEVEISSVNGIELYKVIVDWANGGTVLSLENQVHNATMNVQSNHYDLNANDPKITAPLQYVKINIDGQEYTTNAAGNITNAPDNAANKTFTTNLRSSRLKISGATYPNTTPATEYSYSGKIGSDGNINFTEANNHDEVFRTAYKNYFLIRNYFQSIDPGFAGPSGDATGNFNIYLQLLDPVTHANLFDNIAGVEFNAYASGEVGITYLAANHNKVFMAKSGFTGFHEYGHNVVAAKYREFNNDRPVNSTMNEAAADMSACFYTQNPEVFTGVVATGLETWAKSTNLYRTCDNNYVYPASVYGESHEDSQILSGAAWDYHKLSEYPEESDVTIHLAKNYVPNGYTLSQTFVEWFDAVVRSNDDYWNEGAGTYDAYFNEINQAFTKHGIGYDLAIQDRFVHTNAEDVAAGQEIPITARIKTLAAPQDIEDMWVNYYTNFDYTVKQVKLTKSASTMGPQYTGAIPGEGTAGTKITYYFTYKNPFSGAVNQIDRNYFSLVGYDLLASSDFEATGDSWGVNNSSNIENGFLLGTPPIYATENIKGLGCELLAPGFTPSGSKCYYTRMRTEYNQNTKKYQYLTLKDTTRIESPIYNFGTADNVFLTFDYYFFNRVSPTYNGLVVEVSFDGGTTWREAWSKKGKNVPNNWNWERNYINLAKVKQAGENYSSMRVRFAANSNNSSNGFVLLVDNVRLLNSSNPNYIADIQNKAVRAYPNPASNELTLEFPHELYNPTIEIINALGISVQNNNISGSLSNVRLPLNNLTNGAYFVKITAEGKIYQTRISVAQ